MEGESVTSRYVSRSKFYVSLKVMRYECKAARPSWRLVDFRRLCFRDKTQGLPSPLASSVPFGECNGRLSMALRMRLLRQCPRPLPSGIVYPVSPGERIVPRASGSLAHVLLASKRFLGNVFSPSSFRHNVRFLFKSIERKEKKKRLYRMRKWFRR